METLRDKIKLDNNDNYILFEQGGIGKTSQMKAVFQSYALSYKDGIVPIFVDCKTIDFNRKQPLLTHILLEFCGEDCPDNYENSIVRLENMLTKANSKYKYVFFIDGINECENNKYLVVQDIAKLLKSPSNKIIVSSRINEDDIGLKDFKRFKVKEFTDAQIVTFLNSKGFKDNGNDVELNRLNPSLLKILRVPMFLRLFVETYSAANIFPDMYTSNIVRKADLLQAFIDKIFDDKKEQHSSENDPEYIKIKFALERYLPALAYEMMLMHKYSINNEVFKNLRTQVFNSDYFEKFENISSIKKINNICIEEFSLLNKSNDNYAFSHQVWQDFFCGKFYELCIKYDVLKPFENAMSESVKQFIGEIIGECDFENVTELEEAKKSPLNQFLQRHNLQQSLDKRLSDMQTRNIIEIMKTSRNNNITADYSNLNLCSCNYSDSSYPNSVFFNSLANETSFIRLGHSCDVVDVANTNNVNNIVSLGWNDEIFVWDLRDGYVVNSFNLDYNKSSFIYSIDIYLNFIVCGNHLGEVVLFDFNGKIIKSIYVDNVVKSIKFSENGERVVIGCGNGNVYMWHYNVDKLNAINTKESIISLDIIRSLDKIICISENSAKIIDIHNEEKLAILYELKYDINGNSKNVEVSCDGSYAYFVGKKGIARLDLQTMKLMEDFCENSADVFCIKIDHINKFIVGAGYQDDGLYGTYFIKLWDIRSGVLHKKNFITNSWINMISITLDGKHIVAGCSDRTLHVFDVHTEEHKVFHGEFNDINSSYLCREKNFFITIYENSRMCIWNLEKQCLIQSFFLKEKNVSSVAISSNIEYIFIGTTNGKIIVKNLHNNSSIIYNLFKQENNIQVVRFIIEKNIVIALCENYTLFIFEMLENALIKKCEILTSLEQPYVKILYDKKIALLIDENECIEAYSYENGEHFCLNEYENGFNIFTDEEYSTFVVNRNFNCYYNDQYIYANGYQIIIGDNGFKIKGELSNDEGNYVTCTFSHLLKEQMRLYYK